MSRIPPPRSPYKAPSTPARSRVGATTPTQARSKPTSKAPPTPSKPLVQDDPSGPSLSLKEAIALKRAEAKKAQSKSGGGLDSFTSLEDAVPVLPSKQEDEDILGRLSVRETIERARSTGAINISTRSLPCIPSALFEIHLGITPDALKSVPNEPPLPASTTDAQAAPRRGARRDAPAWFEAQDLQILKAWSNDIVEIQHEISLFGSLKAIDLHKNKIISLPNTFGDLTALTSLDLSHNALTSLPINIFALPELTTLNLSNNALTALPFNAPFASSSGSRSRSNQSTGGSFFTPTITRASTPLPRLLILDVSHNKISAGAIDLTFPASLSKFDLSSNPLGVGNPHCLSLVQKLGALQKLRELRFEKSEIGDDAFPPTLFSSSPFPNLRFMDLGETKVTPDAAKAALKSMKREMSFDVTTEDPPEGVVRVIVGKKVIREAWELEAERKAKARAAKALDFSLEQEQSVAPTTATTARGTEKKARGEVVKEAWEIEAEQGLLTEGGKRRARAAAAAAAAEKDIKTSLGLGTPSTAPINSSPTPINSGFSLNNSQYYAQATQTLTLPPSAALTKGPAHGRAFSLASPSPSSWSSTESRTTDIALPTPTLPLAVIASQSFAQSLKILVLINRRMDRSFNLPLSSDGGEALLPNLEELNLEGCGLGDSVSVSRSDSTSGTTTPPRSSEAILPLLTKLFPNLTTLNLAYNALTSSSLTTEALSALILSIPLSAQHSPRKGLKHLRLRGNRLSELDGLQGLAEMFKGNREVPGWKLDELDLRDNEIGKLPPELGLLPLDVFLVDGNIFRVPQRRVWEREGTKGLLSWLRGRIE